MSTLVQNTIALISNVKTTDEAAEIISNKYPKLSKKAADNVVKDMQDFVKQEMSLAELEYRLQEAGL